VLVEAEDKLEDEPADDLLAGLDDLPVEVHERIQDGLEPQYEDSNHARACALRSRAHMLEAAEGQLRLLVDDMNGRYQVVDADAEVTRCLNADVVIEAFRAWMAEPHAEPRHERGSHAGLAGRAVGRIRARVWAPRGGQMAIVACDVLALPASEAHAERLNKIPGSICRNAGPRLRARHSRKGVILLCEFHSERLTPNSGGVKFVTINVANV
jgi:hypothetical protein